MKIVVDANRIIAALLKKSTTRSILLNEYFEFITPDYTISEIDEHKRELKKKSKLTNHEFDILFSIIFERIELIPTVVYEDFIDDCIKLISDINDAPYLAVGLAGGVDGIWTHDPVFKEQKKIKVFTNIDMLKFSGKIRSN